MWDREASVGLSVVFRLRNQTTNSAAQTVIAFANLVLRTRTFSQEHYDTAAIEALVDYMLYFTKEY
jgi:hypothetical protein